MRAGGYFCEGGCFAGKTAEILVASLSCYLIKFNAISFGHACKVLFGKLHILYYLQCAQVGAIFIPDGHVFHKKSPATFVHPDGHFITPATSEVLYDLAYHGFNLGRMAGEYFPVYGHGGAFEDLRPLVEVAVDVVGIYEGDFHR